MAKGDGEGRTRGVTAVIGVQRRLEGGESTIRMPLAMGREWRVQSHDAAHISQSCGMHIREAAVAALRALFPQRLFSCHLPTWQPSN